MPWLLARAARWGRAVWIRKISTGVRFPAPFVPRHSTRSTLPGQTAGNSRARGGQVVSRCILAQLGYFAIFPGVGTVVGPWSK